MQAKLIQKSHVFLRILIQTSKIDLLGILYHLEVDFNDYELCAKNRYPMT